MMMTMMMIHYNYNLQGAKCNKIQINNSCFKCEIVTVFLPTSTTLVNCCHFVIQNEPRLID